MFKYGITTGCGRVDRVEEMRMMMKMVMLMKTITAAMVPRWHSSATE